MKSMATKYNKRIMVLLLTAMILFQSFYYNYKETEAMELGMTIAIEEALLYLAGLCGVTLACGSIADLTPAQRRQIKDAFDEGCQQSSISQQEQIAWEQQLCEGVLDKTSECWKAFLDSISTSKSVYTNDYIDVNGTISLTNFVNTFSTKYTDKYGNVQTLTLKGFFEDGYSSETYKFLARNSSIVTYSLSRTDIGVDLYLNFATYNPSINDVPVYYADSYGEVYKNKDLRGGCITGSTAQFSYSINSETGALGFHHTKTYAGGNVKISNYNRVVCDRGLIRVSDNAKIENMGNKSVSTFEAFPHWESIGAFNGDRTLSDVYNLINSNAVADNGVVNIPWEDVCDYPIPMPGDTTNDRVGHLSPDIERLWEKLAAGEITWEQFITLLQNAVGVVTLEGVIADDIPIEGDQPIVIEQELVPENPDKPKDKEEIIEENISNTAYTFDIKEFFPFCIPFDLYNIISYLNAEPEAPKFDIPIPSYDRSGNLTMANKITVDLSMFDSVALVFRVCIFIIFIIGLIIITRNLIRG